MAGVFKLPCSLTILFGYRGIKPTNRKSLLKLEGVVRTKENVKQPKKTWWLVNFTCSKEIIRNWDFKRDSKSCKPEKGVVANKA